MNLAQDQKHLGYAFFAAVIVIGTLAAVPMESGLRTSMACMCPETGSEEVECNRVTKNDYIFFTGVLNIYLNREGREVIMCENGERTGKEDRFNHTGIGLEVLFMPVFET